VYMVGSTLFQVIFALCCTVWHCVAESLSRCAALKYIFISIDRLNSTSGLCCSVLQHVAVCCSM